MYELIYLYLKNCWNCGRKASETCSGCNVARYCGSFCQHKDWENHHKLCQNNLSNSTNGLSAQKTSSICTEKHNKSRSPTPALTTSGNNNKNASVISSAGESMDKKNE